MHKIIDYVCGELEDLERKVSKGGKLSASELQYADTLAHLKKNLLKSEEMSSGEYGRGGYSAPHSYRESGSYSAPNYIRPDGTYNREMMGDYGEYGRGRSRDYMGRYTSGANEQTAHDIRMLMDKTQDEHVKHELSRLLDKIDR